MREVTIFVIISITFILLLSPRISFAKDGEIHKDYFHNNANPGVKKFLNIFTNSVRIAIKKPNAQDIISVAKALKNLEFNFQYESKKNHQRKEEEKSYDSIEKSYESIEETYDLTEETYDSIEETYDSIEENLKEMSKIVVKDGEYEIQTKATQTTLNGYANDALSLIISKEIQSKVTDRHNNITRFISQKIKQLLQIKKDYNLTDKIINADTFLKDEKFFYFKTSLQANFQLSSQPCEEIYFEKVDEFRQCKGQLGICSENTSTSVLVKHTGKPNKIYDKKGITTTLSSNNKQKICTCMCAQSNNYFGDGAFYTGEFKTNNDDDVIVGVKFVQHLKTVVLRPIIGRLGPDCTIIKKTIRYAELPSMSEIAKNRIILTLSKRTLIMSDVYFEDDMVVTGLKFYPSRKGITLGLYGKKMNIPECKLGNEQTFIKTKIEENPFILVPTLLKVGIGRKQNKYVYVSGINSSGTSIRFTISDITSSDLGQLTVPGFSSEKIIQYKPIKGIGLFYVNNDIEYSGIIKPYVKSIDSFLLTEKLLNVN